MEFDHFTDEKNYSISSLPYLGLSESDMLEALYKELDLCEICCANCHRHRTITRQRYNRRRDFLTDPSKAKALGEKFIFAYSSLIEQGCKDCTTTDLLVLEFDHIRGLKRANISYMLLRRSYFLDDVKSEISKCEVRCIVCHRIKTINRANKLEPTEQITVRKTGLLICSCGNPKDSVALQCINCYNSQKFDATKYPSLDEIITGVETYGWLPYAKMLGISDNGLRKVAKKLGADPLPRKKR